MKKRPSEHTPQSTMNQDIIHQEVIYGDEIPNQWSLKLKKVDANVIARTDLAEKKESKIVDIKRNLILKKDGKASITFDVSTFDRYSIGVINDSEYSISFCFELSPDNIHFMKKSVYKEIEAWQIEAVSSTDYFKYARIKVFGKNISSIIVYLQGVKQF